MRVVPRNPEGTPCGEAGSTGVRGDADVQRPGHAEMRDRGKSSVGAYSLRGYAVAGEAAPPAPGKRHRPPTATRPKVVRRRSGRAPARTTGTGPASQKRTLGLSTSIASDPPHAAPHDAQRRSLRVPGVVEASNAAQLAHAFRQVQRQGPPDRGSAGELPELVCTRGRSAGRARPASRADARTRR